MVKAHLLPEDSWEAAVTTHGNALFKQGSREGYANGVRHLHAVQVHIETYVIRTGKILLSDQPQDGYLQQKWSH